jgi:hypothetical protein
LLSANQPVDSPHSDAEPFVPSGPSQLAAQWLRFESVKLLLGCGPGSWAQGFVCYVRPRWSDESGRNAEAGGYLGPGILLLHLILVRAQSLQDGRPRGRSSSPGRVKNFLFSTSSRPALGSIKPPIQCVPGALSLEIKRLGRDADRSPPASAEVKKMWIYTSTPPSVFMM